MSQLPKLESMLPARCTYLLESASSSTSASALHYRIGLMSARFAQLSECSSSSSLRRLSALHTASPDVCHQVASSRSYNTHVFPTSILFSQVREFVSSMPARFAKTTRQWAENRTTGSASSSAVASANHACSAHDPHHVLSSRSCWEQVVPACSVMSQLPEFVSLMPARCAHLLESASSSTATSALHATSPCYFCELQSGDGLNPRTLRRTRRTPTSAPS